MSLARNRGVVWALLTTPLFLFAIFRISPFFTNSSWHVNWANGIVGLVQYYLSTLAGLLALIIALLTQHGLGDRVNARSLFLTFGFLALGLLLLASSLGIPYLLLRQTIHPALIWSLFLSLPVSALFFALAGVSWTAVTNKNIVTYRWLLLGASLLGFVVSMAVIFRFATPLSTLIKPVNYDRYLTAVTTIILLLWAARQSHHFWLAENNLLDERLAFTFVLLAEAEVCLMFGVLGSVGWLLHLPLLLVALFITLYPLLRNAIHYQREKRQRTELTQLIVHDLKSPLTIVISGLDLLNRGSLGEITATQHRLLGNLEHCSHEVLRLVDDMLDVERMEEGVMPLHRSDVDLMPLLRELIAELQILADRHRQRLEFTAPESLPLAFVDQDLITRVVHNLVSNALKFTPDDGKIVVQISAEKASIVLMIADSGPGVPPKERQRIFDKFAQLDTKNRRGKGLGLTFCRMAIEAHQGTLTVENSPLGGALFKISLPCEAPPLGSSNPGTKPRPYRLMWGK